MPGLIVRPDAAELEWRGAIDVEHTPEWSRAWRLPYRDIELFPGDDLRGRAVMAAGVRICFRTTSTAVAGVVVDDTIADDRSPVDLVVDGRHVATTEIQRGRFAFTDLALGSKSVELWLPQYGEVRLRHLELDGDATVAAPEPDELPRLIAYGSSITQGRSAASPTRTWPAIVAGELGLDLTCLGYGGQAHLDPMIARMIRDRPAEVITTCLGINVYGPGTFNARSFLPAVLGFLATIRDGHPNTPILVISPIVSPEREDEPGGGGMTLRQLRREVETAAEILRRHGDTDVHLLSGLDVVGPDDASVLWDGLHPDAGGYALMAQRIKPVIQKTLSIVDRVQ